MLKERQIGKTSSFVLSLCGILRDILLITVSTMLWGAPTTALQVFGYTIAAFGLLEHAFAKK
jgi:hypothetical protein